MAGMLLPQKKCDDGMFWASVHDTISPPKRNITGHWSSPVAALMKSVLCAKTCLGMFSSTSSELLFKKAVCLEKFHFRMHILTYNSEVVYMIVRWPSFRSSHHKCSIIHIVCQRSLSHLQVVPHYLPFPRTIISKGIAVKYCERKHGEVKSLMEFLPAAILPRTWHGLRTL